MEKEPEKEVQAKDGDEGMIDTGVEVVEKDEQGEDEVFIPDEEFEYKLVGIVIHSGGARAGHYISYINVNRDAENVDQTQQRWYDFNDQSVQDFHYTQNVEEKCFGGTIRMQMQQSIYDDDFKNIENSHNAYMLVYEKRVKVPFKIDIYQEDIDKIRGQGCGLESLPNCYKLYPGLYE